MKRNRVIAGLALLSTITLGVAAYAITTANPNLIRVNGLGPNEYYHYAGVAETCTTAGVRDYYTNCAGITSLTLPAGGTVKAERVLTEAQVAEIVAGPTDERVIPATGHTLSHTDRVEPTRAAAGNIEYWHCSVCDHYYKDEAATDETTAEGVVLAKIPDLNLAGQHLHGGAAAGSITAQETDGNYTVSYNTKDAANVMSLPFDTSAKYFRTEASFTMHQIRTGVGLGATWTNGTKSYLFMFAVTDMYKSGTNGILFDLYLVVDDSSDNTHKFINLTSGTVTRYVLTGAEVDANKYNTDGKSYSVNSFTSTLDHSLSINLYMEKMADMYEFGIPGSYWYRFKFSNASYMTATGQAVKSDAVVTPALAFRYHNPSADLNNPNTLEINNYSCVIK